eukprot:6201598-Pleurochrysis_carterae.AAC.7
MPPKAHLHTPLSRKTSAYRARKRREGAGQLKQARARLRVRHLPEQELVHVAERVHEQRAEHAAAHVGEAETVAAPRVHRVGQLRKHVAEGHRLLRQTLLPSHLLLVKVLHVARADLRACARAA